ncbi:MAG: hypothetical protein MJZ16_05670 [Bacteroidales bacterium]|nr:hypothetical protein [Bacteroidales bacterium]
MKLKFLLFAAMALVLSSCASKAPIEFAYSPVPAEYKVPCDKIGTLEKVEYTATDIEGEVAEKSAYVYLPYNYTPSKKYEIIYIMHGAQANNTFYLGTQDDPKEMKHMFDHMIASGDIPPVILVMPTIFVDDKPRGMGYVDHFQKELGETLIPLVEGKYSTYAKSTADKDLIASRDHRYFTGFSMGGATTWSVFVQNMRYFRTFMPCSGHYMSLTVESGRPTSEDMASALAAAVFSQGMNPGDFFVFSMTGTGDMAAANLGPQIDAMKANPVFNFGLDLKENNLFYHCIDGGEHNAEYFANYLHSMLPYILQLDILEHNIRGALHTLSLWRTPFSN